VVVSVSPKSGLLREVQRFAPPGEAAVLLRIASNVVRADEPSEDQREEILRLCRALAGEGTLVQQMAEEIARALRRP
jgi:hypothetical protein